MTDRLIFRTKTIDPIERVVTIEHTYSRGTRIQIRQFPDGMITVLRRGPFARGMRETHVFGR